MTNDSLIELITSIQQIRGEDDYLVYHECERAKAAIAAIQTLNTSPAPVQKTPEHAYSEISEHGGDANYWKTRYLLLEQRVESSKPVSVSLEAGAAGIAKLDNSVFLKRDFVVMAEYCAKSWRLPYVD